MIFTAKDAGERGRLRQEIQELKEKLMKARSIIYRSTPCDVDDSFNHVDDCERCAFLRAVRE